MKTLLIPILAFVCPMTGLGQVVDDSQMGEFSANIIIPQRRVIVPRPSPTAWTPVTLEKVNASVVIKCNASETTLNLWVKNDSARDTMGELMIPVPEGAIVKSFSYGDDKKSYKASILPAQEARLLFDRIVARRLDPALLEFAGMGLLKSSVFPVPAKSSVKMVISYDELLTPHHGQYGYELPCSSSLKQGVPWTIRVEMISDANSYQSIYSPTHSSQLTTRADGSAVLTLEQKEMAPGSFKLFWKDGKNIPDGAPIFSTYVTPDLVHNKGEHYWLAVISADRMTNRQKNIPLNLTIALDRSGSMRGEKMKQAKEVCASIIGQLGKNDHFSLITYNEGISTYNDNLPANVNDQQSAYQWLDKIFVRGGTNIYDALETSLQTKPNTAQVPIVLFITDGIPTIGKTSEKEISSLITDKNPYSKRVYSVGLGVDLNAPLLRQMATKSGGLATYVMPGRDLKSALLPFFDQLKGPVFKDFTYQIVNSDGQPRPSLIQDVVPESKLGDLYVGQPIILAGRALSDQAFVIEVSCINDEGSPVKMNIPINPKEHSTVKNDFASRIWAMRKIAGLESALVDLKAQHISLNDWSKDPKVKELMDEVMNLSQEFGIMSNFSSFFADDGHRGNVDMGRATQIDELVEARSGMGAVAMEMNTTQKSNSRSIDQQYAQVNVKGEITKNDKIVTQNQDSFYHEKNVWRDHRIMKQGANPKIDQTIQIGSPEYASIANRIIQLNRQAVFSLDGDVLIELDGKNILLQNSIN